MHSTHPNWLQTHVHTHTVGSLLPISKTLTTLFTHLRSTVACYHDNSSSHNSLYWLKQPLIFSSLSQWTSNDMLVFQPPCTTALVDYHPPNENMRQWYVGDIEREACDREVASLNPGTAGKLWLGDRACRMQPISSKTPIGSEWEMNGGFGLVVTLLTTGDERREASINHHLSRVFFFIKTKRRIQIVIIHKLWYCTFLSVSEMFQ